MVKRRKYGDAWKDVQIDAEQNDAVFDRFFKRSPIQPESTQSRAEDLSFDSSAAQKVASQKSELRRVEHLDDKPTVKNITKNLVSRSSTSSDISAQVETIKHQYRLSKGEAAILKHMLQLVQETGHSECYAKIPQLADLCGMTHRGCQFALKNLQTRGFVVRVKDYDPVDRLGIKFQINVPFE
jgi:hypothetical protein